MTSSLPQPQASVASLGARRAATARRGAFFAVALLPFVLGAAESFDERYERIRQMSAVERAALQHNFETFKHLSPADQARYRELDRRLSEDARSGRVLGKTMDNYVQWLGSLSPVQRSELRALTDPGEKLGRVQRLLSEQQQQTQHASPGPMFPGGLGGRDGFRQPFRLTPEDFSAVMEVVEGPLAPQDKTRLRELPQHKRHLQAIELSLQYAKARERRFPDPELQGKMIAAIGSEKIRSKVSEIERPEWKRQVISMQLVGGLMAEWTRELEKEKPPEPELKKFLDGMDNEKQKQIAALDRPVMMHELLWMYRASKDPALAEDLKKVRGLIDQFRGEDRRPPGPGGRPNDGPFRPRPGNDRPGNGRPDGERPDGDRPRERPGNEFRPEREPEERRGEGHPERRPPSPPPPRRPE